MGVFLSINTGISHDEFHEQQNWLFNLEAIRNFLTTGQYDTFLNYKDKYHGIGFHFFSQPIQFIFSKLLQNIFNISQYGGVLLSKHLAVFLIFFISSLYLSSIFKILNNDQYFVAISLLIYLFFPYFFGHSLFNPKDIPFLSIWVICTFYIIKILQNHKLGKDIQIKLILLISFFSSWLISVRILGILIFLQYLIFLVVYLETYKIDFIKFLTKQKSKFIILISMTIVLTFIMNPILWHNPLEIINSIKWMGKYQQDICTLTLGKCLKSLDLPASYYFIWLFFKLPILIIFGLLLYPLIEKKLAKNVFNKVIINSLLITLISILTLFILFNVSIYDELRHVMFLIPLLFIVGLNSLYLFNKKIFSIFGLITILFFVGDNISINPYQYTWLNNFSKFYNISKNFEVDYWGISNKNLSNYIKKDSTLKSFDKANCIYGGQYTEIYLSSEGFSCFKSYSELDTATDRPYYVVKNVRNVKRSNPKDCELILDENFKYFLTNKKISSGTLWYCD